MSQLATSPEHYAKLLETRDTLSVKYNQTREEMTETLFAADSAKLTPKQTAFAAKAGLVGDASDTALMMGKIKAIFGGAIKPEQAVNVALRASSESPLDFSDFTARMPVRSIQPKRWV